MFTVLKSVALVLLVLLTIGGVIEFVGQVDDVGTADYGTLDAISYVLLLTPRRIYDFLPAAALLGSLLGLGNLAVHRELIVMRASGVSHFTMLGAVAMAGICLMIVMILISESLSPSLGAYAREMRTQALHEEVDVADGQSTWLKDGDRIINLRRPDENFGFDGGVFLFDFDPRHELERVATADSADIGSANEWVLGNYAATTFTPAGITVTRAPTVRQDYGLSPDLLDLSVVREDTLDTAGLGRYIRYLRNNDLDATRYVIAYWGRLANIASVVFMTMLALPFVFGGLRSAGTGARLLVGLVIGLGYYVSGQLAASSGQVFNLEPVVAAWAPTAALTLVTAVALLRIR
jgi:lipopolysaccharide export system permease protein